MTADGFVCRICGRAVRYYSTRFAYAHVSPLPDGYPDHGPIPDRVPKLTRSGREKLVSAGVDPALVAIAETAEEVVAVHPGHAVMATGFVDGKITTSDPWGSGS